MSLLQIKQPLLFLSFFLSSTLTICGQQPFQTAEEKIFIEDNRPREVIPLNKAIPPPITYTNRKNMPLSPQRTFFPLSYPAGTIGGTCMDSSFVKLFESSNRSYSFLCSEKTKDGGIIVGGYGRDKTNVPLTPWYAVITKFDSLGNHLWSKEIQSHVQSVVAVLKIKELSDGSIIICGEHDNKLNYVPTNYTELFIAKLTSVGNLLWLKTFRTLLSNNCSSTNIYIGDIAEGANGDLLFAGTNWNCPYPKHLIVFKLNSIGVLQWKYAFLPVGNDAYGVGVFYEGGQITVINKSANIGSGTDDVIHTDFIKLDYSSGSMISYKAWKIDLPYPSSFYHSFTNDILTSKLSNGNYCVYGQAFGVFNFTPGQVNPHFTVLEFNSNHDFVKGYVINTPVLGNRYTNRIKADKNNRFIYSVYDNSRYPDVDIYLGSIIDDQIQHQRIRKYQNLEVFYHNFELNGDGSYLFINNLSTINQSNFYLEYAKLHNSDTSSVCLGLSSDFSSISRVNYVPYNFNWLSVNPNPFTETNNQGNAGLSLVYTSLQPCVQKAICDTLKIHGNPVSCSYLNDFVFTAYKNRACGSKVNWSIPMAVVQQIQSVNDTTVRIKLNQQWQGWLYAIVNTTCGLLKDSVFISAIASPGAVNLGPDTQLCPGNTITFNARRGYASYLWNNGSNDSTLIVSAPGKYYIDVTDGCGATFSDTVLVIAAPPIPFNIGADRVKCNNDTLHLKAPAGFLNYTWSPNYNINSLTSQNVVVQPSIDTTYYVKAEKTPGCFAFDTVKITVLRSPAINLGADYSFCNGDSAVLDAGPGFNQYLWSDGSTKARFIAYGTGTYSVIGTVSNGCKSYDTLKVLNVWENPRPKLNNDSAICKGDTRTLLAGNFSTYLWQDGSKLPSFTINDTGTYYVSVTDIRACKGSDTIRVTKIWPLPSGFLPKDTAICNYGSSTLRATSNYSKYLWNTGASTAAIVITRPGVYWLQVKDNNQCTGLDSIVVFSKECLKGFYIPNAFTPNNDGHNDSFKPFIGGAVVRYQFTVYNRWGQLIFKSNEPGIGWDGKVKGLMQDSNIFIWRCTYQIEGDQLRNEKGTFVLIR